MTKAQVVDFQQLISNPKPGVFDDVPFSVYRKIPAMNNSYLGKLAECPAKAKVVEPDTPTLAFGRAGHTYILEGIEAFKREYFVMPEGLDRRTKEGKETYGRLMAENIGKQEVKFDDFEKIKAIKQSVLAHPFASILLSGGGSEKTYIWLHKETGQLCKIRTDYTPNPGTNTVIDLKLMASADEHSFTRDLISYGYARGAGMYLTGVATSACETIDDYLFAWIVCEKEPPFRVEVYDADRDIIDFGVGEFHRLMRLERMCAEKNHWPHYIYAGHQTLMLPPWAKPGEGAR